MSNQEGSEKTFVPTGTERDLENARVLLEDPPWCDNPQKYRKTAETIILRIRSFDPENRFAKKLLEKARFPVPEVKPVPGVMLIPEVVPAQAAAWPPPAPSLEPPSQSKPVRTVEDNLLFVAYGAKPKVQEQRRRSSRRAWTGMAAVLVIAGLLGLRAVSTKSQGHSAPKTAAAASVPVPVSVDTTEQPKPELPPALQQRLATGTTGAAVPPPPPPGAGSLQTRSSSRPADPYGDACRQFANDSGHLYR